MSRVLVPPLMRDLTGGLGVIDVEGQTVGEVIANLERRFPGFAARLCPDGARVAADSEVRFAPAVAGG
jgi:molybdopterin converting factor small subunit